jgi:hypothetical protein
MPSQLCWARQSALIESCWASALFVYLERILAFAAVPAHMETIEGAEKAILERSGSRAAIFPKGGPQELKAPVDTMSVISVLPELRPDLGMLFSLAGRSKNSLPIHPSLTGGRPFQQPQFRRAPPTTERLPCGSSCAQRS